MTDDITLNKTAIILLSHLSDFDTYLDEIGQCHA